MNGTRQPCADVPLRNYSVTWVQPLDNVYISSAPDSFTAMALHKFTYLLTYLLTFGRNGCMEAKNAIHHIVTSQITVNGAKKDE